MRRYTGIFFISLYLFTFAEFHNFLQIPILFEHYSEHKALEPNIGFWAFIKLHYLDPIVIDDDYQRDQQLPFRADCCVMSTSVVCEANNLHVEILKPLESTNEYFLFNEVNKPQFIYFDIFQPPRCA